MWVAEGQTKNPYMEGVRIFSGTLIRSLHMTYHFRNTVFREPQNVLLTYLVVRTAIHAEHQQNSLLHQVKILSHNSVVNITRKEIL